jgi:uncharacterized lipoprotein YehR (DUF1307 family)
MKTLRRTAGIASAAALTFALAACGGGSEYCDLIEQANEDFSGSNPMEAISDPEQLAEFQESFQGIADAAPEDAQAAWQATADVFQILVDADGDLTAIDPADAEAMAGMETDMTELGTSVQEECDIDMEAF